ncbi:MAG: NUDIX domain-containing protein [Caldilineaceae bacterium]
MSISDYLRDLRAKVGTELLLMPAVTVVCRDEAGRILLARHRDDGRWGIPGGTMDPDETPANTAVRELWEETGLLVEPVHILGVYGGPNFRVTYPNGDQIASVDTVFEGRILGGALAADQDEISELRYFTQSEIPQLDLPLWMRIILPDLFRVDGQTGFQPPIWQPPVDGVRKGGISDYVRQLRRKIGHDLLLMPSVGALVFDQAGHILLQQRADNGQWSAPVGGMDPDEAPADAVKREVWEETGVLVQPERVLGVFGGPRMRNTHGNGDQTSSVFMLFACRAGEETSPSPDGIESLDARFFPADEALARLSARWQQRVGFAFTPATNAQFEPATWRP